MPSESASLQVVLGPAIELHTGIHGQMSLSPPPGVTYMLPPHRHRFLARPSTGIPFNPATHFATSETIEYALPRHKPIIIHSSRLPVFNPTPWLADMDCLLATITCGTHYGFGAWGRTHVEPDTVAQRQRAMLRHYLSDHCMGLLFRTELARQNLLGFVQSHQLLGPRDLDRLTKRTDVLRPTLPGSDRPVLHSKRPSIIYMGRSEGKGAITALECFHQIDASYGRGVRLVYVGPIPSGCAVPTNVECHSLLSRNAYLELLQTGHIFFSPTQFESFGFALLEAARAGLALVTSRGRQMEHIEELFESERNAFFVGANVQDKVCAYVRTLSDLLDNPTRLQQARENNMELFRTGPLSHERMNRKLIGYYERMMTAAANNRTTTESVPQFSAHLQAQYSLESCVLSDGQAKEILARNDHGKRRILITTDEQP